MHPRTPLTTPLSYGPTFGLGYNRTCALSITSKVTSAHTRTLEARAGTPYSKCIGVSDCYTDLGGPHYLSPDEVKVFSAILLNVTFKI